MAEQVLMIALSPTMETGTLVKWNKRERDKIVSGDVLCEVETDKAAMDYETVLEGTLLRILVNEGQSAMVGEVIAIVGEEGEDISDLLPGAVPSMDSSHTATRRDSSSSGDGNGDSSPNGAPNGVGSPVVAGGDSPISDSRIKVSPLARRIAEMNKIPLNKVDGSGPEGRIVKSDIEKYITETSNRSAEKVKTPQMPDQAAKIPTVQMGNQQETQSGTTPAAKPGTVPPPADQQTRASSVMPFSAEAIPVSAKRRIIAQRLSESKFSAPHYYLTVSVAADNLIKERKNLNDAMKDKISFNSFLIKYSAEALKKHSMVNAAWQGDTILKYRNADIALAVAQTDGLITPVVRDCGNKGLIDIDKELKVLIEKARSNALVPEEYQGTTFTISNLGSYGIEQFTAVINPPASAILAVGEMKKVPVVDDNNNFIVQTQMKLTLSCDHRVIDGAVGAAFLKNLKDIIENPIRALF